MPIDNFFLSNQKIGITQLLYESIDKAGYYFMASMVIPIIIGCLMIIFIHYNEIPKWWKSFCDKLMML